MSQVNEMFKNIMKNFIITFFVILAVYQTTRLWFEDFSSHSLFYSIISDESKNNTKSEIYFTLSDIIINTGNNRFVCKQNDIYTSDFKKVFDRAVITTLELGNFVKDFYVDWSDVFNNKCILYQYSYNIDSNSAKKLFGIKSNNISKMDMEFDAIVITPDINVSEKLSVMFVNTQSFKAFEFEIKKHDIVEETYNTINNFNIDNNDFYYISSVQNGFNIFKKNVMIPRWSGSSIAYRPIKMINEFNSAGGVLLTTLEKNVDIFFDNPAAKWTSTVNDVYTYSDENTVVKYYTNGVMEYSNYKINNDKNKNDSFYEDYCAAIAFLEKDTNIKNEYYLKNYSFEDDKMVFYFDYKVNDFPIILSEEIKNDISMQSMIEVTVSSQRVIRYKRYVYSFEISEDKSNFAEVDFVDAVDLVFANIGNNNILIDDIKFGYNIEKGAEYLNLNWFIKIDDKLYIKSTVKEE